MEKNVCHKNSNGKHYGESTCVVCGEDFDWVEDENADIVVRSIDHDGREVFIGLNAIAKCPHCNYKYAYPVRVKTSDY